MNRIAIIGLDRELAEPIRDNVRSPHNRVTIYDTIPRGYTDNGEFYIEDLTVSNSWIAPDVVIFYSYFENSLGFRKALALSQTPSFPYVDATILHDDKDISLILRNLLSEHIPPYLKRGYVPANTSVVLKEERVVKQGNAHCGDGKFRLQGGHPFTPTADSLLEPFFVGESYRVLVVGNKTWAIRYESQDWRKNVESTQTLVSLPELESLYREHARELHLPVAGFDFIRGEDGSIYDLEVNCYPGLPEYAHKAFIENACAFIEGSM